VINIQVFEKFLFYLAMTVFLAGCLLRACFVDFSDFDYGTYSDHFINAVTAKNISIGLGWSSSGYETYLLNPENLTVGPTIVLPVTATVAIFGNGLAVPGITILILNLFLLALVFRSLIKLHNHNISFYLCAILLVLFFVFFKSYYWYRMLGEITATLLLLLVIIYLSRYLETLDMRALFSAGLAGAFAAGTKELVVLPLVALACFTAVVLFSSQTVTKKSLAICLGAPLLFLSACAALPVLFFFYRNSLLQTQTEAWRSGYYAYADGIHDYYSGINTLREYFSSPSHALDIFLRVLKSTLWIGGTLLHLSFLGLRGLQYWLYIFAALLVYIVYSRKFIMLHTLLAIAAIPLLLWFFSMSEKAMPRHLFIGLSLTILAILFYIASIKNDGLRYALSALAFLLMVLTGDNSSRTVLTSWPTKLSPNIIAAEDMQKRIEQLPPKSLGWIGMIDNNEFEYLSRTPNNFVNSFDLIADAIALDESAYLALRPEVNTLIENHRFRSALDFYASPENKRREIVKVDLVRPVEFNWLHFKGDIAQFRRASIHLDRGEICNAIIYQNDYYVIERCSTADIQAFLNTTGGLSMRPRKWRPYILLPYERSEVF